MAKGKSVKFMVSFPRTLFQAMENVRKQKGINRSEFLRRNLWMK